MASNFVLKLKTSLPQVPEVSFDGGSIFSALTDFDSIGINIKVLTSETDDTEITDVTQSGVNITEMLVYGHKGLVTKKFVGNGTQTEFEYLSAAESDLYVSYDVTKLNGTTSTDATNSVAEGSACKVVFGTAPADGAVIEVSFVKKRIDVTDASWEPFSATKTIAFDKDLIAESGEAKVYVRLRDDVWNESITAEAVATVDITAPSVNIVKIYYNGVYTTDPQYKISEVAGRDVINIDFNVSEKFLEWKAVVVLDPDDAYDAPSNIVIGTSGGSTTSGTKTKSDAYEADTDYTSVINGSDLKAAVTTDGDYTIKIFAKDLSGNWSE